MLHTYAWMPLDALFSSHAVHDPYVVISLNYPQSISHVSSFESSPRSDSLKNIHLRLTHAPISHMSPLQGTLPPARKSTIICVFRSQALCGSDWLTDRWQAVLLLHLLSVQITATCSVITVCKGCGSLCQRSNTLPLIAVKWTSSDVCRSWRSKSFFATLSTPISDPGQYAATPDKWWILAPASVGHENLRCITTVKGIFCSFSWSSFGFKSSMCSSLRKYPYTLKQRALHIICFDKCGCPPHSAGWATCQLAGFLRCPACQHRLPRRPAEHGFYLPCLSRTFHLASWPHKQTHKYRLV